MTRAAFVLIAALAIPAHAADKWYDSYNKGVAAVNARSYGAAADLLQRAISEMPNESTAARAKNQIIVYVPHFWLGIARFNLGDPDAALREWKISEDQGVIQNTDYYARMRDWVNRAQIEKQRLAHSASADSRKAADASVSRAMSAQMDAVASGADRTESYRAGQRKLQEAVEQFNRAGNDTRALQRTGEIAAQAQELFARAAEEGKRAKASRPAARPQQPAQQRPVEVAQVQVQVEKKPESKPAAPAVVPQQQPVQTVAVAAPQPAPVSKAPEVPVESEASVAARVALQQLRARIVDAAQQRRDDAKFQQVVRGVGREAQKLEQQLSAAKEPRAFEKVRELVATRQRDLDAALSAVAVKPTGTPRPRLEPAFRAYARGDLETSEQLLSRILSSTPAAEAFLLRGCARYTKAMLSRNPDPLLASAAADFRSALQLDRGARLDKRSFSPKLVAYFEGVKRGL